MKIKIGTILEGNVVQELKEFSAKRGRPISNIVQEAIVTYLHSGGAGSKQELRLAALKRLCSRPFNIPRDAWNEIMEEDFYEQ